MHAVDSAPVLEMWFDFASPYSYLASERVDVIAAGAGVRVVYRPFLLGPIFKKRGWNDSPFKLYPDKGEYMMREVARLADKYGVPFRRPSVFPRVGLLPARVAVHGQDASWGQAFCHAVFRASFVDDQDIQNEETVSDCLRSIGVEPEAAIAAAKTEEGKLGLRRQVELAEGRGVFGAPMFFAGDEMFWGNDRLEDAVEWVVRG